MLLDKHNKALVLFRGQHCTSPTICSKLPSISFSSARVASAYALQPNDRSDIALNPKVFPVHLVINNPLVNSPSDPFLELSYYEELMGQTHAIRLANKFADWITRTDNWDEITGKIGPITVSEYLSDNPSNLKNLYLQLYPVLDDFEEIAILKNKGFDGAIYAGSGISANEVEYRVFDKEQCISIYKE